MNLEEALRDLATALEAANGARGRDARLRAAREVVVRQCVAPLGMKPTRLGCVGHQAGDPGARTTGAAVVRGAPGPCSRGAWPGAGSVRWRYVRAGGGRIARCTAAVRISVQRIDRAEDARAGAAARHDRRVDAAVGADVSELAGIVRGVASQFCCATGARPSSVNVSHIRAVVRSSAQ